MKFNNAVEYSYLNLKQTLYAVEYSYLKIIFFILKNLLS